MRIGRELIPERIVKMGWLKFCLNKESVSTSMDRELESIATDDGGRGRGE